ncbi:hypothetical protein ACH427_22810 [Streptomyces sp. NPDC020379]|uniref:hypothetical protein n=1 Tax=Streptomyces sp. NPDC020379 TaxID=3365071 RepID=UPI003799BE2D
MGWWRAVAHRLDRRAGVAAVCPLARAPRLDRALKKIAKRGGEVILIDGTANCASKPLNGHTTSLTCNFKAAGLLVRRPGVI